MKVSFLVTYYNQEQYVRQSLDSLLAIKKPCDWEILVGDDGSSDGTTAIVREYMERFPDQISLYVMPRDPQKTYSSVLRASANRLNLLEKATGDFFCTLDGDDWYCDTDFLTEALAVFAENPAVSVVGFGYQQVTDGVAGEPHTLPAGMDHRTVDTAEYLNRYYLPAGACVHRIAWGQDRIEYIGNIGFFDDNDIVINSLNFGQLYAINRVIYAYRQTAVSVYNSMNMVEQAVLNVQGLDADLEMIDGRYRENLLRRNAAQILVMYIWKDRLITVLGKEKYQRYLTECENIPNSLAVQLSRYDTLPLREKQQINSIVFWAMRRNKKLSVRLFLKKYFMKQAIEDGEV